MVQPHMVPRQIALALVFLLTACCLSAEVKQIREYHLHQPRDRKVLFGMTVTPEQDVLAFVAKEDGKWRLSRVRSWLDKQPVDETIEVAGLTRKDFARPEGPWYASLLVTSSGEFVVCISSGNGRPADGERGLELDDIVSVVDLRKFKVMKTAHPPASRDEIRQYFLDSAGHLVLRASKPLAPRVCRHLSERTFGLCCSIFLI
jgi:hypothetical protein